jgi:hypothetical protein
LDTEHESPGEKLYTSLGWSKIGTCPNYASEPYGKSKATAMFMYKEL